MLDLKPLKVSDRIFVLRTPWKGRIILFGFALILGWMTVVNARFPLVPGLLALIAVLAGFYTEQWLFDLEGQVVVHTEGLLFFKRKNSIAFREVARVELRNSRPGGSAARPDLSATLDPTLEQAPPEQTQRERLFRPVSHLGQWRGSKRTYHLHKEGARTGETGTIDRPGLPETFLDLCLIYQPINTSSSSRNPDPSVNSRGYLDVQKPFGLLHGHIE